MTPPIVAVIPANPPFLHLHDDYGHIQIIGWAIDTTGWAHTVYIHPDEPHRACVDIDA